MASSLSSALSSMEVMLVALQRGIGKPDEKPKEEALPTRPTVRGRPPPQRRSGAGPAPWSHRPPSSPLPPPQEEEEKEEEEEEEKCSINLELERRAIKAEEEARQKDEDVRQKEEEIAALRQQVEHCESRLLECELKMRSVEELQKQIAALQLQTAQHAGAGTGESITTSHHRREPSGGVTSAGYLATTTTAEEASVKRQHHSGGDQPLQAVNQTEVDHLADEFCRESQAFEQGAKAAAEAKPSAKSVEELKTLKQQFGTWRKEYDGCATDRGSCCVDDHLRGRDDCEHLLARVAEPQHGTVSGSAPRANRSDRHDRPRRGSGRGEQSSLGERSSSRRRSVSREPSARGRARLPHGRATNRHLGAEDGSSSRRFGRLESGLSVAVTSRRGSERSQRGMAMSRRPLSSSDGMVSQVTIRSRIEPNRELTERGLRRAEEAEEESPPRRRRKDGAAGSVSMGWSGRLRRALNRIDSGSTYSSRSSTGAATPSPSSSPTAPSSPGISAYYSSSRSRHRRERQERRVERLRKFKNKLALVFHHRHDHHHYHHHSGHGPRSGNQEGPSRINRRPKHDKSPWSYLRGVFHRATEQDGGKKKTTSRTAVVTVPTKRRGGGGRHVYSLFDTLVRHKWGARRAPAPPLAAAPEYMKRVVARR